MINQSVKLLVYQEDSETYSLVGAIENPIYVEYKVSYNTEETFKIVAQKTTQNSLILIKNSLIWIESDIVGVVKHIAISSENTITVSGTLGESLLSHRALFEELEIENLDPGRIISTVYESVTPITNLSVISVSTEEEAVTGVIEPENFLDIIKKICQKYNLGYKVRKTSESNFLDNSLELVLKIYAGEDKSEDIIMSQRYGTITDFEYEINASDEVNFVKVLGKDGVSVDVYIHETEGLDLAEYVLDCSGIDNTDMEDEEYKAILTEKGEEILQKHTLQETFSGHYTGQTFEFPRDYEIGDIVTVKDEERGIDTTQQVTSFLKQIDASGVYTSLTFGETQKELASSIVKIHKRLDKLEDEKNSTTIISKHGVGEWLDDAHTCERFNCYKYDPESTGYGRGNYSDMAYCTVQGKDNVILSCDDKYEWVSAYDVINGQLNTMYACEWCYVGGKQNTLGCSDQWMSSGRPEHSTYSTIVHGEQNEIKYAYCSIVTGRGNKFPKTNWIAYSFITGENNGSLEGSRRVQSSVIAGQMNSLGDCCYSVIAGHNHNIEYAFAALVCGEGAVMPAMGTTAEKKLVVGGGSRGNIFEVDIQGNCYLYDEMNARQYNTSGADYAEMYEWLDGNPDNEDRRGRFVTLDGEYIRIANADDDYILGVVSGAPSVVGDANEWHWKGKFKRDVFGAVILDENGEPVLSEDYDPGREYIPQSKRSEKCAVGSHGKLVVIDDGSCVVNGYCRPADGGIATRSDDRHDYRVIKRIDKTHIKIVLK